MHDHTCDTYGPFGKCAICWKAWLPDVYDPLASLGELSKRIIAAMPEAVIEEDDKDG